MFPAGTRVLVVDNADGLRSMMRMLLAKLGLTEVIEAENGKVALERLKNQPIQAPIQLITLDWNMPVMDGFTFLNEIKAHPQYQSIPVLIVTAEDDAVKVMDALTVGAAGYIVKPFDEALLQEKLCSIWQSISIEK